MLKIIILGAIQGLTEFFPVSSSGHLVIAQHYLGMTEDVVLLTALLHIGTILALLTFFSKDVWAAIKTPKTLWYTAVVTAVTSVIGLCFRKNFETLFNSARLVAVFIVINGLILSLTRFFKKGKRSPGLADSALMGVAQGLAITPGISRSGFTITTLLARGVEKEQAFRFSFIVSIPAIIGAFLLEAKDVDLSIHLSPLAITAGLAASYIFGLAALSCLSKIIKADKLHWFGYYCLSLGVVLLSILKT
ncbi:MAG TPA: undecaprenyl-diphosphatase [Candidatus Omnitrophica bacterium]|nr:undecaprenyl-diphosphatase [Candidatus Omnitrophota bacterium]